MNYSGETLQNTFSQVYLALVKQGAPSINDDVQPRLGVSTGSCRYRSKDGLKCAIGWLIPDENYQPWLERVSLQSILSGPSEIKHILEAAGPFHFLAALQRMHDRAAFNHARSGADFLTRLKVRAETFCSEWRLTMPEVP